MFGIGPQELILILVGALIIFGPQRLPEIAGQVGKAVRDFRRMSDDLTGEFQRSINLADEPKPTPPALTSEVIPANSTPNGIGDTIASSLRVETVPSEEQPAGETVSSAIPETAPPVAAAPQDMVISLAPVATKSDPLLGVSLLDEPAPYVGPKSKGSTEIAATAQDNGAIEGTDTALATTAAASYVYEPTPIPAGTPAALDDPSGPTNEVDGAQAQHSVNDAWDAVISTEATVPLPIAEPPADEAVNEAITATPAPLYPAGTYANESQPFPTPERERIDPNAEVTIREKIEAQVAAEAFRERRRIAHYNRTRGKRSE